MDMTKNVSYMTGITRVQFATYLFEPDIDGGIQMDTDMEALESMRAHFESHPAMPGEKAVRERVNELIENPDLLKDWDPDGTERDRLAEAYAISRYRETRIEDAVDLASGKFPVSSVTKYEQKGMAVPVQVNRISAELRKVKDGVNVYAKNASSRYQKVGTLPDSFLANNPMNVGKCAADISVEDFSNGKMKNVSIRLVVDSDRMSGDAVELNEDLFAGLDRTSGLEH